MGRFGPALNASLVALWFSKGSRPVPILLWFFSGGGGSPVPLPSPLDPPMQCPLRSIRLHNVCVDLVVRSCRLIWRTLKWEPNSDYVCWFSKSHLINQSKIGKFIGICYAQISMITATPSLLKRMSSRRHRFICYNQSKICFGILLHWQNSSKYQKGKEGYVFCTHEFAPIAAIWISIYSTTFCALTQLVAIK